MVLAWCEMRIYTADNSKMTPSEDCAHFWSTSAFFPSNLVKIMYATKSVSFIKIDRIPSVKRTGRER